MKNVQESKNLGDLKMDANYAYDIIYTRNKELVSVPVTSSKFHLNSEMGSERHFEL